MTETTTTTRPGSATVTQHAGDARRHGPLPPGQRRIDWFPRFGTHLGQPAPKIPADPVVEIAGAVTETLRGAHRRPGDLPPPTARRRLPLRLGLDRDRPAFRKAWRSPSSTACASSRRSAPAPSSLTSSSTALTGTARSSRSRTRSTTACSSPITSTANRSATIMARRSGSSARLSTATSARSTSVASTCTPPRRPAAPDPSCSTCFCTPTPRARVWKRESAPGRCPAAWSGRSTRPSR